VPPANLNADPNLIPNPEVYDDQLHIKLANLKNQFQQFALPAIEVFPSTPLYYRLRAEFKIWHQDGLAHYAMYRQGEHKKPYVVEDFKVGSRLINNLMPPLLSAINQSSILSRRLFSVEFLSALSGEVLITLLYHRVLDDDWHSAATQLSATLDADIIGRSRKQKVVLSRDYVNETLTVGGVDYHYQQVETGFTQPNGGVNEKMIAWALNKSRYFSGDLLELYCGNANFTIPLASNFKRVLATEIAKISLKSAMLNLNKNNIENVDLVRMSSEEITQALNKERSFYRLRDINLDDYNFSTVFVDPPRAGLDSGTRDLLHRFDNIVYMSCSPATLHTDLTSLKDSYNIEHFAIFDQFPYTSHLECGVVLKREVRRRVAQWY
jgi:tRNA (uracil-5-)-methyltransferase